MGSPPYWLLRQLPATLEAVVMNLRGPSFETPGVATLGGLPARQIRDAMNSAIESGAVRCNYITPGGRAVFVSVAVIVGGT